MFPCCCPVDQLSEYCGSGLGHPGCTVQKGEQPGLQGCWQLYESHPVPLVPMRTCHVSFCWSSIRTHFTAQVKLPITILWKNSGLKRSLRKWKEKIWSLLLREENSGLGVWPGYLAQGLSLIFWREAFPLSMDWPIQPGLAEHVPGPGLWWSTRTTVGTPVCP